MDFRPGVSEVKRNPPGTCRWLWHVVLMTGVLAGSSQAQENPLLLLPEESSSFAGARQAFEEGRFEDALRACDQVLQPELAVGFYCRVQELAVRCCLALNRRRDVILRLEAVYDRDEGATVLGLLPLVWDERLPQADRLLAGSQELQAESPVRRLAAASALLHDGRYHAMCRRTLQELTASQRAPLAFLAETQLWRQLPTGREQQPLDVVERRRQHLTRIPEALRGGPQFVVARALQHHNRMDDAAVEFLWCPLMTPSDSALAAMCLKEAAECLAAVGHREQSRRLRQELTSDYPDSFAAQLLSSTGPAHQSD